MIKVFGQKIEPTRFPDGTTQAWKLRMKPPTYPPIRIDWRFEREDELLTISQLALLWEGFQIELHVPYLPFARQDKHVSDDSTFALIPFARMLNALNFRTVQAVDVHNPMVADILIKGFQNIDVGSIHFSLMSELKPDLIVFPDEGARNRYGYLITEKHIIFEKKRDQATGEILGHALYEGSEMANIHRKEALKDGAKLLIVDDICDGGATFLSIAKTLRALHKDLELHLFVTHGLFSKGRKILEDAGFTLHTTNSLPRNENGIPV